MVLTIPPKPDLLRPESLRHILLSPGPCITIVLPPHNSAPPAIAPDSLLKSNLGQLALHLNQRGIDPQVAAELLRPLDRIATDPVFADSQWGRVIFRSPCVFEQFHLAMAPLPGISIGTCFAVRHLVDELSRPEALHILSLSMEGAALWRCSGISAHLADLPPGVSPLGRSPAEYYNALAHSLAPLFHCAPGGLLLAGAGDDLAIFRNAVHESDLALNLCRTALPPLDESTPISPRTLQTAYAMVRDEEMDRQTHTAKAARARMPNSSVSIDPDTIIRAAFAGRICQLYVAADAVWPDEDLLDLAIAETIVHHGAISALPSTTATDAFKVVAVLRY